MACLKILALISNKLVMLDCGHFYCYIMQAFEDYFFVVTSRLLKQSDMLPVVYEQIMRYC